MPDNSIHDYALERRLRELDPDLHKRYTDTVFVMQRTLLKFRRLFPEYTDHSAFHSINVINFCNVIIGPEQLEKLTKYEIYVLLMSSYLHDSGMAVSQKDYDEFKDELGAEDFFAKRPDCTVGDFVRENHHEFSGKFIEKYAEFFEIPSEQLKYAIVQVSRGHRRTNLYDDKEYPAPLVLEDGSKVCTPYLAALIRLADEIDVISDRNPKLLYDIDALTDEISIVHNKLLEAVPSMDILPDGFVINTDTDDEYLYVALEKAADKMQMTLDLCREVCEMRTPFRISQKWVRIRRI